MLVLSRTYYTYQTLTVSIISASYKVSDDINDNKESSLVLRTDLFLYFNTYTFPYPSTYTFPYPPYPSITSSCRATSRNTEQ